MSQVIIEKLDAIEAKQSEAVAAVEVQRPRGLDLHLAVAPGEHPRIRVPPLLRQQADAAVRVQLRRVRRQRLPA